MRVSEGERAESGVMWATHLEEEEEEAARMCEEDGHRIDRERVFFSFFSKGRE